MVESEMSLIRFCIMNYFAVLLNSRPFHPISTLQVKLVQALISSENEPDDKNIKRLKWIYEHTHEEVDENLAIIELAVFKNLDKGLNRELEIKGRSFYLVELYKYLDEVSKELTEIVVEIGKRYSVDIPSSIYSTAKGVQNFNLDD